MYTNLVIPISHSISTFKISTGEKKKRGEKEKENRKRDGYYRQSFSTTTTLYFEYTKLSGWLTPTHEAAWA